MLNTKWSPGFMRKEICTSPDDYDNTCRQLLDNLIDCPICGYVFEDWNYVHRDGLVLFFHHNGLRKCKANMVEIREAYHVKRASFMAMGRMKV